MESDLVLIMEVFLLYIRICILNCDQLWKIILIWSHLKQLEISMVLFNNSKHCSNISCMVIQGIYGLFYPDMGRNLTYNTLFQNYVRVECAHKDDFPKFGRKLGSLLIEIRPVMAL